MSDQRTDRHADQPGVDVDGWERGALWLAFAAATVMLVLRLALGSVVAEAVATGLLTGVVVFGLAYIANNR